MRPIFLKKRCEIKRNKLGYKKYNIDIYENNVYNNYLCYIYILYNNDILIKGFDLFYYFTKIIKNNNVYYYYIKIIKLLICVYI